ncbi:hypothetical protein BLOT_003154 [Blomia tropicalis]|nr:hypothetical protein BLOT_003154 [Blomia tropicalis]
MGNPSPIVVIIGNLFISVNTIALFSYSIQGAKVIHHVASDRLDGSVYDYRALKLDRNKGMED